MPIQKPFFFQISSLKKGDAIIMRSPLTKDIAGKEWQNPGSQIVDLGWDRTRYRPLYQNNLIGYFANALSFDITVKLLATDCEIIILSKGSL